MTHSAKLYLPATALMSEEMSAYYARLKQKIETCGTKNFPKENGKKVYGAGLLAVTLDRSGKALDIEILETSGKTLLDSHILKVVYASGPFGPLPSRVLVAQERSFDQLVVLFRFNFFHDAAPKAEPSAKVACRWR